MEPAHVLVALSCKWFLCLIAIMISYPPYTNFSMGRCLTYIDTEGYEKILLFNTSIFRGDYQPTTTANNGIIHLNQIHSGELNWKPQKILEPR